MLDTKAQLDVLTDLAQQGDLYQAHLLSASELESFKKRKVELAVEGQVTIKDKTVTLSVGIDRSFPLSLPIVFLRPPNALGFIPHLEEDGYVCYSDSEGLLLNWEDPVGILRDAISKATEILEAGISGSNQLDFMDEFGAYWQRLSPIELPAFLPVDDVLRKVFVYKGSTGYEFVADEVDTVHAYLNSQQRSPDSLTRHTAIYIPLQKGTFIIPPRPQRLWSAREVKEIIREHISTENWQRLKYLGRKWKSEELVILGLPRPSGGFTLVGLLFSNVVGSHPILYGKSDDFPIPVEIQRYDLAYLLPRGGGQPKLNNLQVLVVGCGSVGGYAVLTLVQAGIAHLTLVDPDILKPENIFRHVLGNKALFQPKVVGLKEEIESKYPYISVTTHQKSIEEALRSKLVHLPDFDLVIFATGHPTVELYANRLLHRQIKNPMTVFSWLEAYGIGGHALLTRPGKPGCLQCLFTSDTSDTPLYNRSSFAAYGQSFGKNDLSCGRLYTPFSALDASKTAESAVRLALDGLTEQEHGSPILSWKGTDDSFVAAGFHLSRRYQLSTDQLYENRYDYVNACCPVCGTRRE